MKGFLTMGLLVHALSAHATNSIVSCQDFYDQNIKKPEYKLVSYFESVSLCGFEMNSNTIGFNPAGVAKGQDLSKKETALINYKGNWMNVFSKDQSMPVVDVSLKTLGIENDSNCLTALPVANHVQCPLQKKDIFKIISKYRNESFSFIKKGVL